MQKTLWTLIIGLFLSTAAVAAQDVASLEKLRAAAEQGDAAAQLEMGILYEYGFNFPTNKVPALAWYMLAADQGNVLAAKRRDLVKARMTPEEIEQARKLAAKYSAEKAAEPPVSQETPPTKTTE